MEAHNIDMKIGSDSDNSQTSSNLLFEFISNVYVRWTNKNVAVAGNRMNVHKSCPNLKTSYLDEKTRALIRQVYEDDFRKLNYSIDFPSYLPPKP
mmetsp:Transcript_9191/g.10505  ORF Transcript_9191/g.10505 Transcript_9191/m.10505 type:complete len:95 (-) Transcript_9191:32-316(-)